MTSFTSDLIVSGGLVFGGGEAPRPADIAVAGGRIVAVETDLRRMRGARTEVIDADGGLVTPGFIDAHVHPVTGGRKLNEVSLDEWTDPDDALRRLADYAQAHPEREWIWGGGWSLEWFERGTPSAALLDQVLGDRPAFLYNRDGHGAWVNSKALELAGIDSHTADPRDGRIERDSEGAPQGTLHEGAMGLVERLLPKPSPSDWVEALRAGQDYLLSCGITGWQDAEVQPEHEQAYVDLAGSDGLIGSVVGALWWEHDQGMEQVETLLGRRARMAPGYRPTTVKLMLDGIIENYTASMVEPYLDGAGNTTDNFGIDFIDPEGLIKIVATLDRLGFQCHFHTLGSAAVRSALNALEPIGGRNRHHLAHLQVIEPPDVSRFARLRAIANMQPLWACREPQMTDLTLPYLTERSATNQYPFGDLARAGVTLAMGSDWSVSTADVYQQLEVAVTRRHPRYRDREPLDPRQGLTLTQGLKAVTAGSALVNGLAGEAGEIKVGMAADLAVADRNPFVDGPIGETKIKFTIKAGSVVWSEG